MTSSHLVTLGGSIPLMTEPQTQQPDQAHRRAVVEILTDHAVAMAILALPLLGHTLEEWDAVMEQTIRSLDLHYWGTSNLIPPPPQYPDNG